MPAEDKRSAAQLLRKHARTLELLLHPITARTVSPGDVRSARECLLEMANALDQNADTENGHHAN